MKGREEALRIPRCYYAEEMRLDQGQPGLLVLEDMCDNGCIVSTEDATLPVLKDVRASICIVSI